MSHCRSLATATHKWASGRTPQQAPPPPALSVSAPATAKGINTAVTAVAASYNDVCKPAYEAAVQASQALHSVRSALTTYLRQDSSAAQRSLPDLASLGPAELKAAGNSYRCALDSSYESYERHPALLSLSCAILVAFQLHRGGAHCGRPCVPQPLRHID